MDSVASGYPFFVATRIAIAAHNGQLRKNTNDPYILHPVRVAQAAAICELPWQAQMAAVLHDVVEDTEVTLKQLAKELPPSCGYVIELVDRLTKWWPDDADKDIKDSEKPKYYGRILEDPNAVAIKLLDRADNLLDMVKNKERKWGKNYLKKTEVEFAELYSACNNGMAKLFFDRALEDMRAFQRSVENDRG